MKNRTAKSTQILIDAGWTDIPSATAANSLLRDIAASGGYLAGEPVSGREVAALRAIAA